MCGIGMREEHSPHDDIRHLARAEEVRGDAKRMKAVREYMDRVDKGFEKVRAPKRHRAPRKAKERR